MKQKLNIIYFVCHDLGKHLGCYGAMVKSPNLDRFAAEGVTFTSAFCNSPACSPSRACAMTGQYAHTSGAVGLSHMGWSLRQDRRTIVDYLNDAGYETVHAGLNHERHAGTNHYQKDYECTWDDWQTDNAVDRAIQYLEDRSDDAPPFYLNIGTHEVHATSYHRKFDTVYGGSVPPEDVWIPTYSPDDPALRGVFGKFQASIRFLDTHFQRLLDKVEELGLSENTVIVFTTDHGISNMRSKGTLYDRGVEISLLMQLPAGMRNGLRCDQLIQNIDLAPTILEAAGQPVPNDMQGKSFWPFLSGREYQPHDAVFIERNFHGERIEHKKDAEYEDFADIYDPIRSVRTGDFHYIRRFKPGIKGQPLLFWEMDNLNQAEELDELWPKLTRPRPAEELYHITHDPGEFRNIAEQPEYRHIKAELAAELEQWMRETDDFALRGEEPVPPDPIGWGDNWPRKA